MLFLAYIALFLAPFAAATASDQFKLKVKEDASRESYPYQYCGECFLTCHAQVINTVNLPGQPSNSAYAYGPNCGLSDWQRLMAQCFTVTCQSPPDVAYALEYTSSICNRAGYDVELELPEAYLETTDGAYFSSELYLATSDACSNAIKTGALGTVFAIGAIGAALI